jgi:hypothetical protein
VALDIEEKREEIDHLVVDVKVRGNPAFSMLSAAVPGADRRRTGGRPAVREKP